MRLVALGFETGGSVCNTASNLRSDIDLRFLEKWSAKGSLVVQSPAMGSHTRAPFRQAA
ncbi:MAG TPA: hypothetical protein VMV04_19970 [Thermodesulfobacteriota bacterium]|nr:hypothetical protein [Thermodesulfobacteriota bacterium]